MEEISKHSCSCEGREYAELEKICQYNSCYVCKNGSWEIDNKVIVL
jgi:hypothetical protein